MPQFPGSAAVSSRATSLVRLIELFALLPLLKWHLSRHGVEGTAIRATAVRSRPRLLGGPRRSLDEGDIADAVALARLMLRWTPVPFKCLEESLVVSWFLARRGVPAEVVIAVRKYPFEAHAWARCDGAPLTALPERNPDDFKVISRYPLAEAS
ncbi:MAG: lasso peptide biosynthesis B2 protein [Desertimonas sp.]